MLREQRYPAQTRYDSSVLREMAWRMESSADVTVAIWTVLGVILGLGFGASLGVAIENAPLGAIAGAIGGGVIGYLVGEHRALRFRFAAHLALCQVAIEENTRASRPAAAAGTIAGTATGQTARRIVPAAPAPAPAQSSDARGTAPRQTAGPAMPMPAGSWTQIAGPVPGRYTIMAGNPRVHVVRTGMGQVVTLEARSGGVWLAIGQGSGELLQDDSYRWAIDAEQPGMLLLADRRIEPVALLRQAE